MLNCLNVTLKSGQVDLEDLEFETGIALVKAALFHLLTSAGCSVLLSTSFS